MSGENAVTWVPAPYADIVNNLYETKEFAALKRILTDDPIKDLSEPTIDENQGSISSKSSVSELESSQLLLAPTLPASIKDIYSQRFSLMVVWDILKKRLDTVYKEYLEHKNNQRHEQQKACEKLLAYLYGDFFKLTHALIVLHKKSNKQSDSIVDSLGVYAHEAYFNQLLYPLVDIYYNLRTEFTDPHSIVNKKINKKQPQEFFINNWGGVNAEGNFLTPYPETVTQYICKDLFIFVNNFRLFAVRFKNLNVYFDKGLPTLFNVDPGNYHQFVNTINQVSPVLTQLGWAYYTLRIAFNLWFLFEHVIPGPWMNEYEKSLNWTDRLVNEINKRGFQLANDIVWCVIGAIVCFGGLSVPASIILTASLYVFDVINTMVWAEKDLYNLNSIRDKYLDQIFSKLKAKLTLNDGLLEQIKTQLLSPNKIKNFNFESIVYTLKGNQLSEQDKTLIRELNEFKNQLLVVYDKIEAREKLYHYNLALATIFMVGMGFVAVGICTGIPILTMVGISIVLITAAVQIGIAIKDKVEKHAQPTPKSFFFAPDGGVKKIDKEASDSSDNYSYAVTVGKS